MKLPPIVEYIIVVSGFLLIHILAEDPQFKSHILNAMFIYVLAKIYFLEKDKADK